jgi:hypothetical protein
MKSKFAPSPVVVSRPDANGHLQVAEVIEAPVRARFDNGWEPEIQRHKIRLIAMQETGEEMFAGYAVNQNEAEIKAGRWMQSHPEHRGIRFETVRNFEGN